MAKKKTEIIEAEQTASEVVAENETVTVEENAVKEEVTTEGFVTNCVRLNIRNDGKPNAAILTQVAVNTKLIIDNKKSTKSWLSVTTPNGIKGYCMREYVNLTK